MIRSCTQFTFLFVLVLLGCADRRESSSLQHHDTASNGIPQSSQRTAAQRSDSIAEARFYCTLMHFFDTLVDHTNLVQDTSWRYPLYSGTDIEDEYIFRPKTGDLYNDPADFPFKDLRMSYHAGKQHDYFLINGQRIPETVYTGNNRFPVSSIHRFRYQSHDYLVFNGGLQDYNGYGDRIHFDYFLDLSSKRISASMYKNCWGFIHEPLLYGELNNDHYLDRIKFDGICRPSFKEEIDTITIVAETYRGRHWQQLQDSTGKPYSLQLLINDDRKIIRLGDVNWMRHLSLD